MRESARNRMTDHSIETTLPKTRGDECRRIDRTAENAALVSRNAASGFSRVEFDRAPVANRSVRSIGSRRRLRLFRSARIRRWWLVVARRTLSGGEEKHATVRDASPGKMKIDGENTNGSGRRVTVDLEARWLATRFTLRHFDFAFLGAFARLGAPVHHLRRT